jgi:citrate lyase subunit beta/citryl-CoA lyase
MTALAMRSLLFVPADSERKIAKARASAADVVILDLEDSVAAEAKTEARRIAATVLAERATGPALFVRVNSFGSGLIEADLEALTGVSPDGLVLPKARSGNEVARLAELARGLPLIAIATETVASLFAIASFATDSTSLLGLAWGGEDLSAELGAARNRDDSGSYTEPYRFARTLCLLGARHAGVEPIDAVYTNFRDFKGFEAEVKDAARDGFSAKLAIHPDQVPVINHAFTPSESDLQQARRIVAAFAAAGNAGVIGLDGEMLDVPHLRRAERLIARALRS